MTREQCIEILTAANEWRRYDGPIGEGPVMPNPRVLGEAIDLAVSILQSKEISDAGPEEDTGTSPFTTEKPFTNELRDECLSVRVMNLMRVVDIKTIGDLCGWKRNDLLKIRNLGKKSLNELDILLDKLKLSYGMWESPSWKAFLESYRACYGEAL